MINVANMERERAAKAKTEALYRESVRMLEALGHLKKGETFTADEKIAIAYSLLSSAVDDAVRFGAVSHRSV